MRDLSNIIHSIYSQIGCERGSYYGSGQSLNTLVKYMEIPLDKEVIEVPLFALYKFSTVFLAGDNPDTLVAYLNTKGYNSVFKSLNTAVRGVLEEGFGRSRLVKLDISKLNKVYYGTYGAIFDENFKPLMMCIWRFSKQTKEDDWVWGFDKPIIRLDPSLFTGVPDTLTRFLTGKFCSTCLNEILYSPWIYPDSTRIFSTNRAVGHPQIIIEEIPFNIKVPSPPSVSTTNEDLLKLAYDHIDDIVYDHQ